MASSHILWAENQSEYWGAHNRALQEAGYQVALVRSGSEALDLLRGGLPAFDLLIVDVLMGGQEIGGRPVIEGRTGLSLFDAVREDLRLDTPVLFLTVLVNDKPLMESLAQDRRRGCSSRVLQKPVTPSEFQRAVEGLLTVTRERGGR